MYRTVRGVAALTAATALVTSSGCAGSWPAHPTGLAAAALAHGTAQISTVDLLPVDLQAWAQDGFDGDLGATRAHAEAVLLGAVRQQLAQRGYHVADPIGSDGTANGHAALAPEDVVATEAALSHYGAAAAEHPGQLPVPFLPVRLGTASQADATLYTGGWAYVAESQGVSAGEAVLIALAAVAVVALVATAAKSGKHGKSGGSHGSSVSWHGGGSHTSRGPVVWHGAGRSGGSTRAIAAATEHHAAPVLSVPRALRTAARVAYLVDAFGRSSEQLDVALDEPEWHDDDALPHDGGDSKLYLEMTLVDNHTGLVLWHVHETFPVELGDRFGVARAAFALLSTLPAHVAPPAP